MFAIQNALAGMSTLLWHQLLGGGLFVGFLVLAWFVPLFRKYFIGAALIVLAAVIFEDIGIHDEQKHVAAQEKADNKKVDTAVAKAKSPAVLRKKDPWNRKD